jgi:hypothetical protein
VTALDVTLGDNERCDLTFPMADGATTLHVDVTATNLGDDGSVGFMLDWVGDPIATVGIWTEKELPPRGSWKAAGVHLTSGVPSSTSLNVPKGTYTGVRLRGYNSGTGIAHLFGAIEAA